MTIVDPTGEERRTVGALVDFRDASVLEIGSGDGRLTWLYADSARSVLGLDPHQGHVRKAVENTPPSLAGKVRFKAADATTYRYPTAAFDVAVFAYSL